MLDGNYLLYLYLTDIMGQDIHLNHDLLFIQYYM